MRTRAFNMTVLTAVLATVLATVASAAAAAAAAADSTATSFTAARVPAGEAALGLALFKHPWKARAGGVVTIRAKVYNRGDQDLSNVNVRFSVPAFFTVGRSSTWPKLKPARRPIIEEDVRAHVINAYWLDMPIKAGKARAFAFKARIANCPQLAGKTAQIGMMAYLTAPNGTVVYSTSIFPKEIAIDAAKHSSKTPPPPTTCNTPAPSASSLPFQVVAVDQACLEAKLTPMTGFRRLAAEAAPVSEAAEEAGRTLAGAVEAHASATEPQQCFSACSSTGLYTAPFYFQLVQTAGGQLECYCCQHCTPYYRKDVVVFQANTACAPTGSSCQSDAGCCAAADTCVSGTCQGPSAAPTVHPTQMPSQQPTTSPTSYPTNLPTEMPSQQPTMTTIPTGMPTNTPSQPPTSCGIEGTDCGADSAICCFGLDCILQTGGSFCAGSCDTYNICSDDADCCYPGHTCDSTRMCKPPASCAATGQICNNLATKPCCTQGDTCTAVGQDYICGPGPSCAVTGGNCDSIPCCNTLETCADVQGQGKICQESNCIAYGASCNPLGGDPCCNSSDGVSCIPTNTVFTCRKPCIPNNAACVPGVDTCCGAGYFCETAGGSICANA